jgi:hypothetical protein
VRHISEIVVVYEKLPGTLEPVITIERTGPAGEECGFHLPAAIAQELATKLAGEIALAEAN